MKAREAILIILAASAAGCQPPGEPLRQDLPPPVSAGQPMTPLKRGSRLEKDREFIFLVRLQLIAMELPLGSTTDSSELWSYLNEEPVGARVGSTLGINGVRIGLGREADWPEIRAILSRLTARPLRRWTLAQPPGEPLSIPLKQNQDVQTVFLKAADRTLTGYDYPPGDDVVTIVPTINYDDPTATHVTGALAVRSARRRPQYVETPTGYVLSSEPVRCPLPGMDFRLIVPPDQFVVIGPGAAARDEDSPGGAFLTIRREGVRFETVLVILPEVFAEPVRRTGSDERSRGR